MSMGAQQLTVEGIVVRRQPYGESDRIVEVLTPSWGRVTLFAAGARASRRRFQGVLELFATAELQLGVRSGMWRLESGVLRDARLGIRRTLEQIDRAAVLVDVARTLAPEQHEARDIFGALANALDAVNRGDLCAAIEGYPRMLAAAGILPAMTHCDRCRLPVAADLWLDPDSGSVVCPTCSTRGIMLGAKAAAVWRMAPCTDAMVASEVEQASAAWVRAQVGRALRSVTVMASYHGAVAGMA